MAKGSGKRKRAKTLRRAVREAVAVFERTGRMGDAALIYGRCGFPIFPLAATSKAPMPRRDPDPTGKYPDGIPRTGGFYKATCDASIIRAWWKKRPDALIGLPMGERTGVWAVDVDTAEDHADGTAVWRELTAQHGAIVTREHRSATGGPHLLFDWHAAQPIRNSKGELPNGVEVKGQGGYIVVPPSWRKQRAYTVFHDVDPVDAPQWLVEAILQGRRQTNAGHKPNARLIADLEQLPEAMKFVPNGDLDWNEWTAVGLALYAACGDAGLELFDAFSQRSAAKYDARRTLERWQGIKSSPPDRTGANKLFKIARENGWAPKPRPAALPTYGNVAYASAAAGRRETRRIVDEFFAEISYSNPFLDYARKVAEELGVDPDTTVWAARIDLGLGKTQSAVAGIAGYLNAGGDSPPIYAVPRHKLGESIKAQFAALGIDARIFRGRGADDPENPDKKMCLNQGAVRLALWCHADVTATCCKQKKRRRIFFNRRGYQRQMPAKGERPQVWIVASDMLFHTHEVFGKPAAVVIDESIWRKGIRGIEPEELDIVGWTVRIAALLSKTSGGFTDIDERDRLRNLLGETLQQQQNDGGVERANVAAAINGEDCEHAIRLEWAGMPAIKLRPGMGKAALKRIEDQEEVIAQIKRARRIIKVWQALRDLLEHPEIAVCGRLTLEQGGAHGRFVEWRGVEPIHKQFKQPTLMLDATLPAPEILQVWHAQVEVVADIKVPMPPSVRIRQILKAPTSSNKLGKSEKHLNEIRRYIIKRWIEIGHRDTLVICQKQVDKWLSGSKLPQGIALAHYNDITGLDHFKDVRLLILLGRVQPGPQAPEALAAALSGARPTEITATPGEFAWYKPVKRGIRLLDGRAIETVGDEHPDALVESVRWLICEAELLQAIGRGRGINRTKDTLLDIDILADTCLPITVNTVEYWAKPSLLIETACDGCMLIAPVDMMKLWPTLWPNEKAAFRTVQQGVPKLPGFEQVTYQLKGAKMNKRLAYFNRSLIPNPAAWLEQRLGPLTVTE